MNSSGVARSTEAMPVTASSIRTVSPTKIPAAPW
jgi:hypothetical protein